MDKMAEERSETSCLPGILVLFAAGIMLLIPQRPLGLGDEDPVPDKQTGAVLRILSVRKMTPKEYSRRVQDDIGADYSLRLRLEAPVNTSVYVFAPDCGQPLVSVLERQAGKLRWLTASPREDQSKSPGFERKTAGFPPCWIRLSPAAAYEWAEEVTQTSADTEEARSVYVKSGRNGKPVELISGWFTTEAADKGGAP